MYLDTKLSCFFGESVSAISLTVQCHAQGSDREGGLGEGDNVWMSTGKVDTGCGAKGAVCVNATSSF